MENQIQKIGVTAFIENNGKALVLKRSAKESFLPGYYELPGGKIEFGESAEDALKREIREEAGLNVETIKPYSTFSYTSSNGAKHTIDIQFIVRPISTPDSITLSDAHDSFVWINPENIDDFLITDEMKNCIKKGFASI